ncbi:carbohydrate ABC transporter permease [Microbacterium nymphoidis]|uniref:carbohydrate ABC transporter permease n=1 Tax=Microbacterium nymphoidis TaxID=2898586 RepID=UPI001E43944B|nr:carbohydrate ABC transporter permease [Microbacterium nymphoidis]MCD2498340.1 carbohydrate ABC transporter permease [Microbacterium nymphoidis]
MSDTLATATLVTGDRVTPGPPRRRQPYLIHAILIVGAIIMVFPFFWQLMTSFKTLAGATAVPPQVLPNPWDFSNYARAFEAMPFGQMFLNSAIITVCRTIAQVILCTMAGYAFARIPFRGRGFVFVLFLSVLMVPGQLFLLPQYEIIQSLGLLDSLPGIIIPGMFAAFGTFLMRQFFLGLPVELEEAARIDGANQWQIFQKVMLPLAKPGIIALAVFTSLNSWNDLLWPLVVTSTSENMPLSVGLATLKGMNFTDIPVLMAGSVLATIPMVIVFIVLQKQFIQGIAFTGGKG